MAEGGEQTRGLRNTRTVMTQGEYTRLRRLNEGWLQTSIDTSPDTPRSRRFRYIRSHRRETLTERMVSAVTNLPSEWEYRGRLLVDVPWTRYMDTLRYFYAMTRPNKIDERERIIVVRNVEIPSTVRGARIGLPLTVGDIQMAITAHRLIKPILRVMRVENTDRDRNDRIYEIQFSALTTVRDLTASGSFLALRNDSSVSYELEADLGKERFENLSHGLAAEIQLRCSILMYPGFEMRSTIPSNLGFPNYASIEDWPHRIFGPHQEPSRPPRPIRPTPLFGTAVPRFPASCEVKVIRVPHNFDYPQPYVRFKDCVICQIDYVGEVEIVLLPCIHVFHADCLHRWFTAQRSLLCPMCRQSCKIGALLN